MLRDEWGGFIGHRENPSIMLRVLRQSTGFLKSLVFKQLVLKQLGLKQIGFK